MGGQAVMLWGIWSEEAHRAAEPLKGWSFKSASWGVLQEEGCSRVSPRDLSAPSRPRLLLPLSAQGAGFGPGPSRSGPVSSKLGLAVCVPIPAVCVHGSRACSFWEEIAATRKRTLGFPGHRGLVL